MQWLVTIVRPLSMRMTVINPNSNTVHTEQISRALDPARSDKGVSIDCVTLQNAPLAIESDDDIEAVIEPICTKEPLLSCWVSRARPASLGY